MTIPSPSIWLLLLLLVLPVLWWRWARGRYGAITYSSIDAARAVGPTWVVRLRWLVPALRSGALILLIVCLARPQKANEHTRVFTEGVAIQLLVDRSESMLAEDFVLDRRPATRLAAVRNVVEDFIDGGDALPGRPNDLVGLITFGTFADSVCPLTLDHAHLIETVRQTEISDDEEDRATAIGDAVALGVERIRELEGRADISPDQRIKSKIMILLTDGENTAGDIDPLTAAEMAAAFDIKIYTIAAGGDGTLPPGRGLRRLLQRRAPPIDERTLKEIARITGGSHFRATDHESLESIYGQIDELERTKVEQTRYAEYREMSVEGVHLGGWKLPPLLAVVFVLLAAEILLANTRWRRLP